MLKGTFLTYLDFSRRKRKVFFYKLYNFHTILQNFVKSNKKYKIISQNVGHLVYNTNILINYRYMIVHVHYCTIINKSTNKIDHFCNLLFISAFFTAHNSCNNFVTYSITSFSTFVKIWSRWNLQVVSLQLVSVGYWASLLECLCKLSFLTGNMGFVL